MKDYLDAYEKIKTAIQEGNFPIILWLMSLFTIVFFFNGGHFVGGFFDEKILISIAIVIFSITSIVLMYLHWINKYSSSDLSQPMETKVGFDFLNKILLSGMNKNKFQYIGVYEVGSDKNINVICDRSAKSEFQKEFSNNKKEIFEAIYKNSAISGLFS